MNQESHTVKEPASFIQPSKMKEKGEINEDEDEEIQRVLSESYKRSVSLTSPQISSPSPPSPPSPIELGDKDIEAAILMSLEDKKPKISPVEKKVNS